MTVSEIPDRARWDAFLAEARPKTFLQSWAWGETQRALGEVVVRLGAYDGESLVGIAQAVTVTARRGKFLHVPHGPVVGSSKHQTPDPKIVLSLLLEALRGHARRLACAFLRVSPVQEDADEHRAWYRDLGFRPAPIHLHAERLWILDLTPPEDALLHGMRKTTRNLLRRAEREGVTVRMSDAKSDLERFFQLYEGTARREHFTPFPKAAIEAEVQQFTSLRKDVNDGALVGTGVLIGTAEWRGQPLAGAVVPLTSWSAFYHHGASARTAPNIPAAYALQWALIREAQRRGCTEYNFWGIAPRQAQAPPKPHPWVGLTLFKTGFGGREAPLVPTQDLPLSPRYWITYAVDTFRRWKRGV